MLKTLSLTIGFAFFWGALIGSGIIAQDPPAAKSRKTASQPNLKTQKQIVEPAPTKAQQALDGGLLKVAPGFRAELIYSVPKETQGSWVNLCFDPEGRMYASDQYGALYRVSLPPVGQSSPPSIEKIPADIGAAQGLLWAFDSLYVVVNGKTPGGQGSGLYRLKSSLANGLPNLVEKLKSFEGGGGEHGPHAVLLHPDGKRLTIVCGNQTKLVPHERTLVAPVYGDDHLLPRLPDGNGFMKGVLAPGGVIYHIDPEGKQWELASIGFRNQYDAAYNQHGELFTYDADMEWDVNTPWYRPTRVCHITAGSEWGWRNGAGKYPEYYVDNLPPVVNIGPGSPTGVCFGYGAKFPAKYQQAFYISDWSYGKLYAVHLKPQGSSYTATFEEFVSGTPLPLTDVVVNPKDGALYFAIGGRKTQSGLYRVTYTGNEPTTASQAEPHPGLGMRHALESRFSERSIAAVDAAWAELGNEDRFVAAAARNLLELQPLELWAERALQTTDAKTGIPAWLALARVAVPCPLHQPNAKPSPYGPKLLERLSQVNYAELNPAQQLGYLRTLQVAWHRHGSDATDALKSGTAQRLNQIYPANNRLANGLLTELLVYFQHPQTAAKAVALLKDAPTQEEQIEYARSLRQLKTGWTSSDRQAYFAWFNQAAGYKGGNSLQGFLKLIKADAIALLTDAEKTELAAILEAKPATTAMPVAPPRAFVKKYTLEELVPQVEKGLQKGARDYEKGRKLFAAASCFACHRYDQEGGSNGPDLTGIAGRFNTRDLLESILDPSKEVSDQYAAVEIYTIDGKLITGRIANLNGDNLMINTDMLNPNGMVSVNRKNIEELKPAKNSMMPAGLLDTLTVEEIIDLTAYLVSRGDRSAAMFKK